MDDLQRFKDEFSDKDGVQLNCAGIAPLSRTAALEYSRLVTVHQTLGGLSDSELIPVLIGTRVAVAEFIENYYVASQYSLAEKLTYAKSKKNNPYPATPTELGGGRWWGRITCGPDPFLYARLVVNVAV